MKPMATDIYTFSNLIERKCLYVDSFSSEKREIDGFLAEEA